MNTKDKKTETKTPAPAADPKRRVQTIDIEQLEDVIGGMGDEAGAYPLRMATEE